MKVYGMTLSPPVRKVRTVADILGLNLELENVDLMKGEHMTEEYLKLNPHHQIPTFVDDDGFVLTESGAIMGYLATQYGADSNLYPKDVKKRALVDQALYFDASSLSPAFSAVIYPIIRLGGSFNEEMAKGADEKLALLNEDLGRTPYAAGQHLTIADVSLLTTFSLIEATGFFKLDHLTNVHAWIKRIKDSGRIKNWDELITEPAKGLGDLAKEKLNSGKPLF